MTVLSLFGMAGIARADRITVAREATVPGAVVRLGDVATLEGGRAHALAGLALGAAPGAGEVRTLDGGFVLGAIRREAGSLDGITYTIPAAVRVRRATQEIPEAAVRHAVEGFVAGALGAGEAVVRTLEVPGPIRVPAGAYEMRVIPPAGVPLLGHVRLQLDLAVDGRPAKTVWITTDIGLYAPVVLARRPIARGETLGADDLALERRDLAETPRGVLTAVEDATGSVARAPIAPWAPIRRDQVASPAAIHRGDVVLLVAERGPLRITMPGEARDDAGPGQQVRVLNRASRKDVVGRVLDASTVAVDF